MSATSDICCFVSDVHLGRKDPNAAKRENDFLEFLNTLGGNVRKLYLLGDIFDLWIEYPNYVPEEYGSVLAALKALAGRGCEILFFRGNHDWWTLDYLGTEVGLEIVKDLYRIEEINGLKICIGHGDTPGCSGFGAWLIFHLFRSKVLIRGMRLLPRKWIKSFGTSWSSKNYEKHKDYVFEPETSSIRRFAESIGSRTHIDHFIFGHFHRACSLKLDCGSTLHILGDWEDGPNYLNLSGMEISGRGLPNTHS